MNFKLILWRSFLGSLAIGFFFTAAIGAMHMPGLREARLSRTILSFLSSACPVNQVSMTTAEKLRRFGVSHLRGSKPAPRRPAMGFVLDDTTESEAKRILKARGIDCEESTRGFRLLLCKNVRPEALGMKPAKEIRELVLAFGGKGRLIQVSLFRRQLNLMDVGPILSEASTRLKTALGDPTHPSKTPLASSPANLVGKMSAVTIEYRFVDYVAKITAAHLPSGVSVYEQYMSTSE